MLSSSLSQGSRADLNCCAPPALGLCSRSSALRISLISEEAKRHRAALRLRRINRIPKKLVGFERSGRHDGNIGFAHGVVQRGQIFGLNVAPLAQLCFELLV